MKITIYTTTDCQYSKQEKDYLTANKLVFEEKNLEVNKEFLTEMMAISNNFAGTPVTRVEKDDGTIAVLKGFTKEEFDTTFGLAQPHAAAPVPPVTEPAKVETPTVAAPVSETPVVEPTPATTPVPSDELNSVLDKLEEKTEAPPAQTAPPADSSSTPPSIPDFPDATKTTA